MGKSFFEKRSVFSIRKLAVGACSVLIGVSFLELHQYWQMKKEEL